MKISILIPTKNEPLINELIKEVHQVLKNLKHEIIVIDKSKITPNIKDAKLVTQESDGLGKAIIEGLAYASGDVIVTMDGDFSHDPNDLLKLIGKINEYDIIIGSRFVPNAKTEDRIYRRFISFLFRKFASIILDLNVEDSMSGFIAMKRSVYQNLKLDPIGYKINTEVVYKGKRNGFSIHEVPIVFHKRKIGGSKSGIKEGLRTLFFILKLKFES